MVEVVSSCNKDQKRKKTKNAKKDFRLFYFLISQAFQLGSAVNNIIVFERSKVDVRIIHIH